MFVFLPVHKSVPQSLVPDLRGKHTLFVTNYVAFSYPFKVFKARSLLLESL